MSSDGVASHSLSHAKIFVTKGFGKKKGKKEKEEGPPVLMMTNIRALRHVSVEKARVKAALLSGCVRKTPNSTLTWQQLVVVGDAKEERQMVADIAPLRVYKDVPEKEKETADGESRRSEVSGTGRERYR